jgi:hypothetical protein
MSSYFLSQVTTLMTTTNIEAYGAYPFSSDETYQVGYTLIAFPSKGSAIFSNHSIFHLGSKVSQTFLQRARVLRWIPIHLRKYEKSWKEGHAYSILTGKVGLLLSLIL